MPTAIAIFILILLIFPLSFLPNQESNLDTFDLSQSDIDLLEFPLNLEFLEAEFFLFGALGQGLDDVAPDLAGGGPEPIGPRKAQLDQLTNDIILQFALQEVGHLRAIKNTVNGFSRPMLNLTSETFGDVMNEAFRKPLNPPFDPYANSLNYLLASYVVPYVGLTGYVGANPKLQSPVAKRLVAGLLAVESGQDGVIRALLYERANESVSPYDITVAEFTNRISNLRNNLGKQGVKSEGAEGSVTRNILAGDKDSIGYDRTPEDILRIVYGTRDESVPGGFYPNGAKGTIAKTYLQEE